MRRPVTLLIASALTALSLAGGWGTGAARGAPGDLDGSFDSDGKRTIDYGGLDGAFALALRPDGRIVVAGTGNVATDIAIHGLLPDGSDDSSFGSEGYQGVGLNGADFGRAVAIQPQDGKIVVAGHTNTSQTSKPDLAVVRRNPDGSPDMSFAGSGQQIIDYAGGADKATAVALDQNGRIVTAGFGNTAEDVALQRFLPDGTPELSLGIKLDGVDEGHALALQPDGKILIAGATQPAGGDHDLAILRLNADGGPDTSFAGDGKRIIDYDGGDVAHAIAVQPDGRIVIVGDGYFNRNIIVERLMPDGSGDPSFNFERPPGIDPDDRGAGAAVGLQPDGKILVAGTTFSGQSSDFAVLRIQPGGALDTTFDGDGKKTIDFPGGAVALALALQPDGRIVVAGQGGIGQSNDFAVARLLGDSGSAAGGGPGGQGTGSGVPRCAGKLATIVGTSGRDRLRGTRRADVIATLGANDLVRGGRGNDRICAGAGNDRLLGNSGNDRLFGQSGKDRLAGGPGRDRCLGGPGRDRARCERKSGI